MESDPSPPFKDLPKKRPTEINLEEPPKISKLEQVEPIESKQESDEESEEGSSEIWIEQFQIETYKYPRIKGCRTVDSFQKLNRVEEGTYGVVYRAKDKDSGDIVALKRVKVNRQPKNHKRRWTNIKRDFQSHLSVKSSY
jgi:cell division cycle 2-like protein